jgi:hypothetical protein
MAFTLPELPYAHDALEPHIDTLTMQIHHGKHHNAYVTNLNKALEGSPDAGKSIEDLMKGLDMNNMAVRNNGGGHYNHSLFWTIMAPNAGGKPEGDLAAAIDTAFGSFDAFKEKFAAAGATLRQRLGLALRAQRRQTRGLQHPEPGQPVDAEHRLRRYTHPGNGRVGACLLPALPEPPSGLHHRVLERGELARGGPPLRRWQIVTSNVFKERASRLPLMPVLHFADPTDCAAHWR